VEKDYLWGKYESKSSGRRLNINEVSMKFKSIPN
jgi:hypothetical protein